MNGLINENSIKFKTQKRMNMLKLLTKNLQQFHVTNSSKISGRLLSVDALRGFDMFWIMGGDLIFKSFDTIFHNSSTQWIAQQLDHVEWLGFQFYDIIMPLFLFIVGVAMPFSFKKRFSSGASMSSTWKHILKRVAILWLLGMMVQGNLLSYSWASFHFYSNTLQSIAAGYLIASILIIHFNVLWQIIGTVLLLLAYWLIMAFLPTPGGTGLYEPLNNVALYIDKLILGAHQDGTTYSWILSSLNFTATVMLGVFSGYILQTSWKSTRKLLTLIVFAVICYFTAILWNYIHPIIKHIWTGSFVLYVGSFSIALLIVFYFIIDVLKFKLWSKFFVIIGSNAIVAYVAWHLFDFRNLSDIFTRGLEQYTGSWYNLISYTASFTAIFLILWYMNRKKIFIKV